MSTRTPAEQGTLEEVLAVEKELGGMLDEVESRSRQWLEERSTQIERQRELAIAELAELEKRGRQEADQASGRERERIADRARRGAARLEALDDDRLLQATWTHLARILPRTGR